MKRCFRQLNIALWLILAAFAASFQAQEIRDSVPAAASFDDNRHGFSKDFRVEKIPVKEAGAEIITIFANVKIRARENAGLKTEELPLFSILRDTLGDEKVENDRLRYVWLLTYVKPSLAQKVASYIPFLYSRTTNKKDVGSKPPPAVMDLSPNSGKIWNEIFWTVFKYFIINDLGAPVRSSIMQNRANQTAYRQAAVERALNVLALYESIEGEKILTESEVKDIRARMWMSDKFFGSMMQSENLHRVYEKNIARISQERGRNWELLRQYAEAQRLYFEPLQMPDGSQTHALVWIAEQDLRENGNRKFNARFLNIQNPWKDARLNNWQGYREVRWYDEQNREVAPDTPGALPKTLIPLALYGLDYPKIPILLLDFRDRYNPKKREMSRRILEDVTRNVLSVSKFGNLPYFFGRFFYDWVTARRGIDLNQSSRFRSYSQLKLLLSLDASLDPNFRSDIADRLESVSLNPLENDLDVETAAARKQYENLVRYAKSPNGLAKKLTEDRREEMVKLNHGGKERLFFDLAHFLSFGIYTHREKNTPELFAQMDLRRQADFHDRFLREVAQISAKPEIDSNIEAVKKSLLFINRNFADYSVSSKTVKAVAKIFSITDEQDVREICLKILEDADTPTAKKELLALYNNEKLDVTRRNSVGKILKLPAIPEERAQAVSETGQNQ